MRSEDAAPCSRPSLSIIPSLPSSKPISRKECPPAKSSSLQAPRRQQVPGPAESIHGKGAKAIYWLQDYYPELLRTLWNYPQPIRSVAHTYCDNRLGRWDLVVKAAGNLFYHGENARVIRNWPTIDVGKPEPAIPKTALYSGNLGYCHHIPSFLNLCEELRAEGYSIRGSRRRCRSPETARLDSH